LPFRPTLRLIPKGLSRQVLHGEDTQSIGSMDMKTSMDSGLKLWCATTASSILRTMVSPLMSCSSSTTILEGRRGRLKQRRSSTHPSLSANGRRRSSSSMVARTYRLPETESIGAFHALQQRGVPSRFLYFPDENHWVLNPENSLKWHHEVFKWFGEFVGERWDLVN